MILQISLLVWPNIPQLKLGDIKEYYLSDIPQFLKPTSTSISFRFKIKSRWERVSGCCRRGEKFFLFIKSYLEIPKRKQKKTSRSKQGKYVWIPGAVRWHYLFQDGNNFRERSSRKTVSSITKLNRGYSLYIQIYLCQGNVGNFPSKIGSFRNNIRYRCILDIFPWKNIMRS